MKYVDANLDASGFNVDYILLFYPSMSPKLEYMYSISQSGPHDSSIEPK